MNILAGIGTREGGIPVRTIVLHHQGAGSPVLSADTLPYAERFPLSCPSLSSSRRYGSLRTCVAACGVITAFPRHQGTVSLADAYARIQNDAIEQSLQVIQFACVDTDSSARLETVRVRFRRESLLIHVSGIETQGGFADAVQPRRT